MIMGEAPQGCIGRWIPVRWSRRFVWDCAALAILMTISLGALLRMTQPLIFRPHLGAVPPSLPGALEQHVRFLASCAPRNYENPANLDQAADYILAKLEASGGRCRELTYSALGGQSRVLLARYGPEGHVRVVAGAHYDSCGNTPGADDNASGTAGLLELARLLGTHPPAVCVELAAYPHEEVFGSPWMGSAKHAKALRAAGEPVRAMVCLEMIGTYSDSPGSQHFPMRLLRLFYPNAGNFVFLVGRSEDRSPLSTMKRAMAASSTLPVRSICAPFPVPGLDLSDHMNFWKEGFQAVMVTDTAFYRNERYHTKEDTPETLDYVRMAEVVRGVFAAVQSLASQDSPVAGEK
jgi:hypothetical protein